MTHVNEVEYESGYNVDPDVVSVGAAAHAGASVGSAPVGINRAFPRVEEECRSAFASSKGKISISVLFFGSFHRKTNSNHNQN